MAVGVALVLASAPAASADHKVTICHATGSASNPYVVNSPAASGVYHGHIEHQHAEDIIPPFTYRGQTYSQNWDAEGMAIFNAGCRVVTPTTSTHTTTKTTTTHSTTSTHSTSVASGTKHSSASVATTTSAAQRASTAAGRTAVATTTRTRTVGPIPGAVAAGTNESSSWQLPVGGALIALGALGTVATIARRNSAER